MFKKSLFLIGILFCNFAFATQDAKTDEEGIRPSKTFQAPEFTLDDTRNYGGWHEISHTQKATDTISGEPIEILWTSRNSNVALAKDFQSYVNLPTQNNGTVRPVTIKFSDEKNSDITIQVMAVAIAGHLSLEMEPDKIKGIIASGKSQTFVHKGRTWVTSYIPDRHCSDHTIESVQRVFMCPEFRGLYSVVENGKLFIQYNIHHPGSTKKRQKASIFKVETDVNFNDFKNVITSAWD